MHAYAMKKTRNICIIAIRHEMQVCRAVETLAIYSTAHEHTHRALIFSLHCTIVADLYEINNLPSDRQTVPLSEVAMHVALRVSFESSARSPKYAPVLTAGKGGEKKGRGNRWLISRPLILDRLIG